jgi:FixJ family two-component response regulator
LPFDAYIVFPLLDGPQRVPEAMAARILIVDGDLSMRRLLWRAIERAGFQAATVGSGEEALTLARLDMFDLLLIDLQLPDLSGLDLVRTLRQELPHVPLMLVSGVLTVGIAVEAMKLGVLDVLSKPVRVERLVDAVRVTVQSSLRSPALQTGHAAQPRSAAERWARQVLKGCESEGDLRTLHEWAAFTGVSYSSLRELCLLVNVPPHDARDLTRVLSAVMKARRFRCHVEVLLNVGDRRTLRMLMGRAGIPLGAAADGFSVTDFLERQRFVPSDHQGLRVLRRLLVTVPCGVSV